MRHSPVSTRVRSLWLETNWSEERDRQRRWTKHGWNGLKAQTYCEPGRHGQWTKNMSLGMLIPITGVIGMNGIFSDHVSDPFLGRRLIVIETQFPRNWVSLQSP